MAQEQFYETLAEGDLLARSVAGDRDAREELARACLPRVRRTVLLTAGGGQDVEDLVQIAMARIFAGLASFRGDRGFLTWLDKVTVNAIRQHYRRRPLVSLFAGGEEWQHEPAPRTDGPESRAEGQRLLEKLAEHLSGIRPKKRLAVVLAAAYGYTSPEAAEIMSCSTETAKKRLQHGRRELLARLRKDPYLSQKLKELKL